MRPVLVRIRPRCGLLATLWAALAPTAAMAEILVPAEAPTAAPQQEPTSGFSFGGYGRLVAATDARGAPGGDADIVAYGSRLDESSYVELDFSRWDRWPQTGAKTRLVTTLALGTPVFHYTGEFDAAFAVRNLYIEESGLGLSNLSVWVGSRMYRGDNIYWIDHWPLDNLNTLGGGATYQFPQGVAAALHVGVSQPDTPLFRQAAFRPAALNQFGATEVEILDRQRVIASAKLTAVRSLVPRFGLQGKASLYGEAHHVSRGERETTGGVYETLPSLGGGTLGAQLGVFGPSNLHVDLFGRFAWGLAAYGEFASPGQVNADRSTAGAREVFAGMGGNWESHWVGIGAAAYVRSFRDASPDLNLEDVDEGLVLVRPSVFFADWAGVSIEGSFQHQTRGVLVSGRDSSTASTPEPFSASVWRVGVMPYLSPAGRGSYARPQFRLIYSLAVRNEDARSLYAQDDVRSTRDVDHFVGIGAEWWFDSNSGVIAR